MAKKKKRKVSAKTKVKRAAKKVERGARRVGKKVKRKAKPLGKKIKKGARKVGKKAAKFAKTNTGRAGIGAGAGALLLGPVGAVAGAAAGLATRNPGGRKENVSSFDPGQWDRPKKVSKKGASSKVGHLPSPGKKLARAGLRKQDKFRLALEKTTRVGNPEPSIKISSLMGGLLLDYHKASPAIEHVAASGLRQERVSLSIVKRAREDLRKLGKIQTQTAEREQIQDIVDALDAMIQKYGKTIPRGNPARAFSLETQIKRQRQSKAKKSAMGMARDAKVYRDVRRKSVAAQLRKLNPGHPEWEQRFSMLDTLTSDYRSARRRWLSASTKAGASESAIARAKKRMDDSEDKLILYADMVDLSPKDLKMYLAKHGAKRSRGRSNPKKKKATSKKEKNPRKKTRPKASQSQRLIRRCQKLWEHYCERPGKARLKDVLKHLERMEGHDSKKVKEERARCMRAAKTEAKRLKMKV